MQAADDHDMDKELKRILKTVPLEQPDGNFTDRLMDRLEHQIAKRPHYGYTPLISLRTGLGILVIGTVLVVASSVFGLSQTVLSFRVLDLISIEWEGWNAFAEKIGTSVMIYAMVFLILGMGIQFFYLKRWHAKQLYAP